MLKTIVKALFCVIALVPLYRAAAQKHPYLFFTREKLTALQKRIDTDSFMSANWTSIRNQADSLLVKGDAGKKIDYLSLAYLMTGDKKYAGKIKNVLLQLCSMPTWSDTSMMTRKPVWRSDLGTAHKCWIVAVGYDAVYDILSANEKKIITEGVVRMGIQTGLGDWIWPDTRIHTLNSMGHNWWSSCVGMAGLASLAIMTEVPEARTWAKTVSDAMEEWYNFNGDELQFKPKTMDRDGGMYESFGYAQFGFSEFLFFKLAFTNALPDVKQPYIKGLEQFADWFIQCSYPRTGAIWSIDFGDSHYTTSAERPLKLLYALGYHSPNIRWYLDQVRVTQHKEGLTPDVPIGLVYEPEMKPAPVSPDLPVTALYKDMDWALMRDSWQKDATLLAVKSGHTWNHSHADANSFILYHKGEAIIKDAGNVWYGSKDYPGYFFQSEAHNVVMFNGKAQPRAQQYYGSPLRGELSEMMDGGHIKYLLANAVGPTSAWFSRNFRNFIWIGKVLVIIDDVKSHEPGQFSWLLHPGGASKKVGGNISITANQSAVLVRPLFPETLVEGGFDHDFPENLRLTEITAPKGRDPLQPTEIHYAVSYPAQTDQTKFITAVILKDSVNDTNIPKIERLHSETMNGLRIVQDGKVTELYLNLLADGHIMHRNSVNTFNGWETDAYLTGISYPEGTAVVSPDTVDDYFIAYGSFLRQNGKTLFTSLSKLFTIASRKKDGWNIRLQGQPLVNAGFYTARKPASLQLNGKEEKPVFSNGYLQLQFKSGQ